MNPHALGQHWDLQAGLTSLVEPPAQSGGMRTLIHCGPTPGGYVRRVARSQDQLFFLQYSAGSYAAWWCLGDRVVGEL